MPSLNFDERFFDKFLSDQPVRKIAKNRPLLYQGEVPTMGFYLKSGIVKIYNITSQGEEKIIGYEGPGALFPIEWFFNHTSVSLYYYDTFTDSDMVRIHKDNLVSILNQEPAAARAFLDRYISMYIGASMHVHALEQSKVRQKLLSIMQYLVLRFGIPDKDGKHTIDLKLTHQELANMMGTSRETTSTEMGKLTREGVLKVEDSQYTVDTNKALRLLGEEDFNTLNL